MPRILLNVARRRDGRSASALPLCGAPIELSLSPWGVEEKGLCIMTIAKKQSAASGPDNGKKRLQDEGFGRASGKLPNRSLVPASLRRLFDGSFEAQCGRCLRFSFPVVAVSLEHAWSELMKEGWTWYTNGVRSIRYASCLECLKAWNYAPVDGLRPAEHGLDAAPPARDVSSKSLRRHQRVAAMPWHVRVATVR